MSSNEPLIRPPKVEIVLCITPHAAAAEQRPVGTVTYVNIRISQQRTSKFGSRHFIYYFFYHGLLTIFTEIERGR